jgi:hypothetical protein
MCEALHPLPQYASMAWCLVKAQGLYLYLLFGSSCSRMSYVMLPGHNGLNQWGVRARVTLLLTVGQSVSQSVSLCVEPLRDL